MKGKAWVRGVVWMAVGGIVHVVSGALGHPLMLRGTSIPWGLVVAGAGLVIMIWDVAREAKRTS